MSFFERITTLQESKKTRLCLGLDPDYHDTLMKQNSQKVIDWAENLIKKTAKHICCIKPQAAFFYALEVDIILEIKKIAEAYQLPVIYDHKYSDISTTANAYCYSAFKIKNIDAVTINPYMGKDTAEPFLKHPNKAIFVLCYTSNPTANDFQNLMVHNVPLYIKVAQETLKWGKNVGLVVGTTQIKALINVRKYSQQWILAPGLGAQGGHPKKALEAAKENIIFPISRGIANDDDPNNAAEKFKKLTWL